MEVGVRDFFFVFVILHQPIRESLRCGNRRGVANVGTGSARLNGGMDVSESQGGKVTERGVGAHSVMCYALNAMIMLPQL